MGDHGFVRASRVIGLSGVLLGVLLMIGCPGNPPSKQPPITAKKTATSGEGPARTAAAIATADAGDGIAPAGPPITYDEICGRSVDANASAIAGKKPFRPSADPHCPDTDHFCDQVDKTPNPKDTCFVANDNIVRAERESRATANPPAATSSAWDGKTAPKYLDRIDAHLHFTAEEKEKLKKNGFVVLDRFAYTDYANAFHEVFQLELPIFVGVDPILHAVFKGTELALERVEKKRLKPALMSMLKKLRAGLPSVVTDEEARKDLDVFLSVAWSLNLPPDIDGSRAKEQKRLSVIKDQKTEDSIGELLVASEKREMARTTLFGRERMVDFSQLEPRGHYMQSGFAYGEPRLEEYFRAMMWLSRLEFNIVSRSSRSSSPDLDKKETPREVKAALFLAELIERTGASEEVRLFEETYTTFAGKREDIPPAKLLEIARTNKISKWSDVEVADKMKVAIGANGFKRTARTHFTVEGAPELPAITTLFGPRIVPDVAPLTRVVHDQVLERKYLGAADVGFLLGHDRAKAHITDWNAFGTQLPGAFAAARDEIRKNAAATNDVYAMWLRSVLALADKPNGVVPSFMKNDAYADHRLSSALVGYGQIRHAFVLLAGQGYDAYGCEIPDGFVEPAPAVFDALLAHVRLMRSKAPGWAGLERVLAQLSAISHVEVSGKMLSEPQRRWLGMVTEHIPNGGFVSTGEPPKWTGWYFDMFEDREHGAGLSTDFIADYFTLTNAKEVAYLGAEGPRLGVFVVDTNGEPRAMVGPVAKGYEAHAPIEKRFNDETGRTDAKKVAPWRASYASLEKPDPALGFEGQIVHCEKKGEWRVAFRSAKPAGPTSIVLLDHHGDPVTNKLTLDVGSEWKIGRWDMPAELANAHYGVEAIHVRIEDLARSKTGHTGPFDLTTTPSVFHSKDYSSEEKLPSRPRGVSAFGIGLAKKPEDISRGGPTGPNPYDPHGQRGGGAGGDPF
jgi:hypothetical protein